MIETIIEEHPNHVIIIGADFNTEMRGQSPFDEYWTDLMRKFQLACCDSMFPASSFTYRHNSLDQHKWNDHFLVSKSLIAENALNGFHIPDDGDNPSDHLPICMNLVAKIKKRIYKEAPTSAAASLKWNKMSYSQRDSYTTKLNDLVNAVPPVVGTGGCENSCRCDNKACHTALQVEYDRLTWCFSEADKILPRHKPGTEKDWWTSDLSEIRKQSIEIHSLWKNEGRPRNGPIQDERLRVRATYKRAIRAAQRSPKQASWDRLHFALADEDTNSFWKAWRGLYNKNKSHLAPVVNGCSDKVDIANTFKDSFSKNSKPNDEQNVKKLNERFAENYKVYVAKHNKSCDCNSFCITSLNVIDAISSMKTGKCADANNISAEHFHYAPLSMILRLTSLFNLMLKHAFVPKDFRMGHMVPIVKDQQGNRADPNNYRGITISPIMSKVLEHVFKFVFAVFLETSPYQFGFKKRSSTVHALHCLKSTVNYYINNGSRAFCTFLDASKAFDRLVHAGLFLKLMERQIPLVFLDIIVSWYNGLLCCVRWGDQHSDWFEVTAGVRQGGVLSPDFYCIYVNDLLQKLKSLNIGCHYLGVFAAAFFYADDMAIVAPSIHGLQKLLNLCAEYCAEWDIGLNAKKSKCLYFGKRATSLSEVELDGRKIEWVDEWNYLGVSLKSGKVFGCSVMDRVKKFYRCSNAIFRIEGVTNDMVMSRLMESHCVPLLTYAIEVVHVANRDEKRQLRVAYNSLFRKIFDYRRFQSVTALQLFLAKPTWEELVQKRMNEFRERLDLCAPDALPRIVL